MIGMLLLDSGALQWDIGIDDSPGMYIVIVFSIISKGANCLLVM